MRIAVAGGTGLVGRMVTEAVTAAGHDPVVLARSTGVDLTRAVTPADLRGARRLIDVTNVDTLRRRASVQFFEATTHHLLDAGRRAGVEHHVALSVIGCDRVDLGYYLGKRRQEELVLAGAVPATVVRASQLHELADQLVGRSGRLVVVPSMLCRPVAAREVAAALVRCALAEPTGLGPQITGPAQRRLVDMVRAVLAARRLRRLVVPLRLPGAVGRGLAGGALLPTRPAVVGVQPFDEWLAETATP